MKFLVLMIILCSALSWASPVLASEKSQVVVMPDDIEITDKTLETKLIKTVKEKGVLTSARQVNSYMIAVLCEYPEKTRKAKPYCTFRKVKVLPTE